MMHLGYSAIYEAPFFWHRYDLGNKELILALDEAGYSYVELCTKYILLHEQASEIGNDLRSGHSDYAQNVAFFSTAWSCVHIVDRLQRSLKAGGDYLRIVTDINGQLRTLETLNNTAKRYRDLDAHRVERFGNNVNRARRGPLRGSISFVYFGPEEKMPSDGKLVARIPVILCESNYGEPNSLVASFDDYPWSGAKLRRGASCISLHLDGTRVDLSIDVERIIDGISRSFAELERQIFAQLLVGQRLLPQTLSFHGMVQLDSIQIASEGKSK